MVHGARKRTARPANGAAKSATTGPQRVRRRRECRFCKEQVDYIDYKDVNTLTSFVPERDKILPRRLSGVCAPHQRMLARAIKRARAMALLTYVSG